MVAEIRPSKHAASSTLKRLCGERGLSRQEAAAIAGIKRGTLRRQLAQGVPRQRLRLVLETVVDSPVWSSPKEFLLRKALTIRLGFDPYTVPAQQLRGLIPGLKLKGWKGRWQRRQLIELLKQAFLSQQPKNSK